MALYPVTCFANHTKARSLTRRPSISPLSSLSQAQSHRVAVRRVAAALPPGHGVTASLSQSLVFAHQQPGLEPSRAKTKSTPPSHASLKPWHRDPQKKTRYYRRLATRMEGGKRGVWACGGIALGDMKSLFHGSLASISILMILTVVKYVQVPCDRLNATYRSQMR